MISLLLDELISRTQNIHLLGLFLSFLFSELTTHLGIVWAFEVVRPEVVRFFSEDLILGFQSFWWFHDKGMVMNMSAMDVVLHCGAPLLELLILVWMCDTKYQKRGMASKVHTLGISHFLVRNLQFKWIVLKETLEFTLVKRNSFLIIIYY